MTEFKVDDSVLSWLPKAPAASPSMAELAMHNMEVDLKFINEQSIDAAKDTHITQVIRDYAQRHPMGFLARSSEIFARSIALEAVREDLHLALMAMNQASGKPKGMEDTLLALKHAPIEETFTKLPKLLSSMQRETLVQTRSAYRSMDEHVQNGLWGSTHATEKELHAQFDKAAADLDEAIAQFDNGNTDKALSLFANATIESNGHTQWYGRALRESEQQKRIAKVGVAMGAGALAYFSGGASLALLAGTTEASEVGWGIYATSLLVNGAVYTGSERTLNYALFNTPILSKHTAAENVLDVTGETLRNSAMFGFLRLLAVPGAALPILEAEPLIAAPVNAAIRTGYEFGGLTSFNMLASASNLIDETQPSIDQVMSREALSESFGMLLGMKIGGLGLRLSGETLNVAADGLAKLRTAAGVRIERFAQTPAGQAIAGIGAPMPLMVMLGYEVNPIKACFNWIEGKRGKLPPIIFGAINVNLSFALSLGLRWVAATQFPDLAEHFPRLFQQAGDANFFTAHNLWTTLWQTNAFGLALLNPIFAGPVGAFSTRVANVKLDPKDFAFDKMDRSQITKAYLHEFGQRGLMGVIKLFGFHFGDQKGLAAGVSADIVGNGGGDMVYAKLFKPQMTFSDLFVPGAVISTLVATANTIISQHKGFNHAQQYVERMKIGVLRSGIYRGFCVPGTLTQGLNLFVQAAFGVWAIGHALKITGKLDSISRPTIVPATQPLNDGTVPLSAGSMSMTTHPFAGKDEITIAVTDSGMGGLSVVTDIVGRLRESPFKKVRIVFFNALPGTPDGPNTYKYHGYNSMTTMDMKAEVFDRALDSLQKRFKPDLISIACNTLSVVFPHTVFAKTAHAETQVATIGNASVDLMFRAMSANPAAKLVIMGTPTTVHSNRYQSALISRGITPDRIIGEACPELAAAIETDPMRARALIQNHAANVANALDRGSKVFVSLNCTHYGYEAATIESAFREQGIEATILNPNPHMMDDHLTFQATSGAQQSGPEITIEVHSQMPLDKELSGGFVRLIESQSPATAVALRAYTHDPDLFTWEDVVWRNEPRN